MSEHKVNINDDCRVVLTDYGIEILEKNDPVLAEYNLNSETGVLEAQLWCLMNAFGDTMYNGGKQVFEKNEIIFF